MLGRLGRVCVCVAPVQLQSKRPVNGGKAQQPHPAQQNAAENAGLEIQNSHLQERKYKGSTQEFSQPAVFGGQLTVSLVSLVMLALLMALQLLRMLETSKRKFSDFRTHKSFLILKLLRF